jgi:hypothetical protein
LGVARFLSAEWFGELSAAGAGSPAPAAGARQPELVVEIVVSGAPDGEVRYQVVVDNGRPTVLPPASSRWPAQVRMASDYATISGIASGRMSPAQALSEGRARLGGDTNALSSRHPDLAGLDLVPPALRASTTF